MATETYMQEWVSFADVWRAVKSKWVLFPVVALGAAVLATVVLWALPERYTATIVVAPASDTAESGRLAGMAGRFGAVGGLLGLGSILGSATNKDVALATMQSNAFVSSFIRRHEILVPLFAGERWDMTHADWVIDDDLYDVTNGLWVRRATPPQLPTPSDIEATDEFLRKLDIQEHIDSDIIEISLTTPSPTASANWLNRLVTDLNDHLRSVQIVTSQGRLTYLNSKLETTTNTEVRDIYFDLIREETQKMSVAQTKQDFMFTVIDPAVAPVKSNKLPMLAVLAVSALLGLLGTLCFVIFRTTTVRVEDSQHCARPS